MRMMAEGSADGALDLTPEEYRVLVQRSNWLPAQRNVARRGLHAMLHGTMDAVGLSIFQVPAEYVAAGIAVFVSPCNMQAACSELAGESRYSTTMLTNRNTEGVEEITSQQCFAMVLQAYDAAPEFRKRFEERTQRAIEGLRDNEG